VGYLGLVNEPCFEEAAEPDAEFGLRLDKRTPGCGGPQFGGKDPFADEAKYPGVQYFNRGEVMPVGSFYGYPTGITGQKAADRLRHKDPTQSSSISSSTTGWLN
jgi:hypothetical protein